MMRIVESYRHEESVGHVSYIWQEVTDRIVYSCVCKSILVRNGLNSLKERAVSSFLAVDFYHLPPSAPQ